MIDIQPSMVSVEEPRMFHRKALARLLQAANDCHLLATAVMNHESIHIKTFDHVTLERLVEACKPLMNDYARLFQPSAAEREALLHRVATHELEVALHRAYVRLFRAAHAWFIDHTPLQQLGALHRVQANAAPRRMQRLLSFQRSLEHLATLRAAQVA